MGEYVAQTKRVLITGGRGLIAGRVAEYLASEGYRVRLGTRRPEAESVTHSIDVAVVGTNWQNEESLGVACRDVDIIINAMGMNARDCLLDPVGALMANGVNTALLLKAAIAANVKRFIHLSTAHVYSSNLQGTISESSCPANLHPYATSHRAGEDAVLWASRQGLIEGIVLRLSNAYGRPLDSQTNCWTLLVNDLCRQAVENRLLKLHGDGLQVRDFIPMSRVCRFIGQLCSDDLSTMSSKQDNASLVFNVGSGVSMSVASMAELVQSRCEPILGYSASLIKQDPRQEDSRQELSYVSENLSCPMNITREERVMEIDALLEFCQKSFGVGLR